MFMLLKFGMYIQLLPVIISTFDSVAFTTQLE